MVTKTKNKVKRKDDVSEAKPEPPLDGHLPTLRVLEDAHPATATACPYCEGADFVKRGTRKNKFGLAQLYICRNPLCGRTFTAKDIQGKKYPLKIVIECMSHYNLGFTFEQTCSIVRQKFGAAPDPQTASAWYEEYKPLCRYERLRPWAVKYCKPTETVEVVTMAHRQLYRFRYHRAKTYLMLEEFRNRNLKPLKEYLDSVSTETPHQYFSEGGRMSEIKSKFDKADMIVKSKTNFANHLAEFVPLKFKVTDDGLVMLKGKKRPEAMPKLLTGHIDFVQIRNGCVHLLDYKPNAAKEQPIEQLTWYAMAMSRLTGLRLFEFKCGWFDEKDYFEFYPLHVVKKLNYKRKRHAVFRDGSKVEVPREGQGKASIV
ncbi:MAG: hypothetical protein UY50_C0035G0004 [Parcubacteria group bacterium GW2011_GWA2_49_9]|nr:MAG: hypothetical protein UY50_C0035G0004 [Parcubacteria group bacterium GW2011_GWA2_49_9]